MDLLDFDNNDKHLKRLLKSFKENVETNSAAGMRFDRMYIETECKNMLFVYKTRLGLYLPITYHGYYLIGPTQTN